MDEADAVDSLRRLGLSTYEARVFIALQKLDQGSASEIAEITDVPRSQVYGAADALEDRGLIEVQHATPIRYRPVSPTEAERRLAAPLEAERERAVEYLETVKGTASAETEREAEVWTVHGEAAITDRFHRVAAQATTHVFLGVETPAFLPPDLLSTLDEQTAVGVSVTVVSADSAVLDRVPDGVETAIVPPSMDPGDLTTRVIVADGDAVVLAVRDEDDDAAETAIWSAGTGFATVLTRVIEAWFDTLLQ